MKYRDSRLRKSLDKLTYRLLLFKLVVAETVNKFQFLMEHEY
jgi:hypothetical protein